MWELIHGFLFPMLESFVGIYDKHIQHRDLNSSHKVLIEVDVEYLVKKLELNCSIVDLIDSISALCQM